MRRLSAMRSAGPGPGTDALRQPNRVWAWMGRASMWRTGEGLVRRRMGEYVAHHGVRAAHGDRT